MTREEIFRLARLFASEGVDKIRFTGGEPTVRKDLEAIIADVASLGSVKTIAMTTNGLVLSRKLPNFVSAGLNQVNISLDTFVAAKFDFLTRRQGHSRVLDAIEQSLGLLPSVKVNCVVMKGVNDEEICDFVEFTKDRNVTVRFIEYMPFDGNKWSDKKMVTFKEMVDAIKARYPDFAPTPDKNDKNDTTKHWSVPGYRGSVGFITSMTEHFCGTCNRLRLMADGNLKVCLFGNSEVSLLDAMRAGKSDDDLREVISAAVLRKKASHAGMYEIAATKNRSMITIGG